MCMLTYNKERKLTKAEFETCWIYNPDGVGFAYIRDGVNVYEKGFMNIKDAWARYETLELPHVCHFRLASFGPVVPELTHPFICTPESPTPLTYTGPLPIMLHNGVAVEWQKILESKKLDGVINDTRALASYIGSYGVDKAAALNRKVGGRYVLLANNEYLLFGGFFHNKGIYFSNDRIFSTKEKKELTLVNLSGSLNHAKEITVMKYYLAFIKESLDRRKLKDTDPRHVLGYLLTAEKDLSGLNKHDLRIQISIGLSHLKRDGVENAENLARSYGL